MKIIVIGSGVIGVTTAYFLRREGHEVCVIDGERGPGRQASFANGSLLTPSMAEPWNSPGSWRVILSSLARRDAALQLRLRTFPELARWGVAFLRNSRPKAFSHNTRLNMQLALYSLETMGKLRRQTGIDYGRSAPGALKLFRNPASFEKASDSAARLSSEGLRSRSLSVADTIELEPALAPLAHELVGSVHHLTDEIGDAHEFCVSLADQAKDLGVEFHFGKEVSVLEMRRGQIAGALIDEERFVADRYIVACGSYSARLLRRIGVRLPVQPAKGYSVTIVDIESGNVPHIPVIDEEQHAAIVPVKNGIRVAGTAEFAGYDRSPNPARIGNLLRLFQRTFPQCKYDSQTTRPWCGLRAMSTDGVPIIGGTRISNLLVNTAHGHLGWTMAVGSAQLLADVVCGNPASINPEPYSLSRFGS